VVIIGAVEVSQEDHVPAAWERALEGSGAAL
jgi:hypothetical protein